MESSSPSENINNNSITSYEAKRRLMPRTESVRAGNKLSCQGVESTKGATIIYLTTLGMGREGRGELRTYEARLHSSLGTRPSSEVIWISAQ